MMKVLNFGSLNLDIVFDVEYFVKAGETISSLARNIHAGGKGLNQSIALSQAGAEVFHAGNVGEDGRMLLDMLSGKGVDISLVRRLDGATGQAVIQVESSGQNSIILYDGANKRIDDGQIDDVLSRFERGDMLLLQNEINNIGQIMRKAKLKGMSVALNPSPITNELLDSPLELVDWFILNEIEGQALSGETEPKRISKAMLSKYSDARIVLTLGKDGVLYSDKSGSCSEGIFDMPVVDTTAAGDTFTGFFLSSVVRGESVAKALKIASTAAGIAVSRAGAGQSIPSMDEVRKYLA